MELNYVARNYSDDIGCFSLSLFSSRSLSLSFSLTLSVIRQERDGRGRLVDLAISPARFLVACQPRPLLGERDNFPSSRCVAPSITLGPDRPYTYARTHTHICTYATHTHPEAHYARYTLNKQNAALYFALLFARMHDNLQRREKVQRVLSVSLSLSPLSLSPSLPSFLLFRPFYLSLVLHVSALGVPFTRLIHLRRHMIAHNSTLSRSNKNIRRGAARAIFHVPLPFPSPSPPLSRPLVMFFTWPRTRALRRINLAIPKRTATNETHICSASLLIRGSVNLPRENKYVQVCKYRWPIQTVNVFGQATDRVHSY